MKENNIKQMSNWPPLEAALTTLVDKGAAAVPDAVFAAVVDRLRSAIEAPESGRIVQAADILEAFYRQAAAIAPESVRQMTRRAGGDSSLDAAYLLGKVSFAQLFASRVADTRADARFLGHIRDRRYLPYLQALYGQSVSVSELKRMVRPDQRLETVSRKLGVLRGLGIVVSRKEGTTVVNGLSPAAKATLEQSGLVGTEKAQGAASDDAQGALDNCREKLPRHLQEPPIFPRIVERDRRAA